MKQDAPICLRFQKSQRLYLEKLQFLINKKTGRKVTMTYIIKQMMSYGQEQFHNKYKITFDTLKRTEISKEKT